MSEAGLRTKNQAEYQRRFRFAEKVGDTIENVLALDEHECADNRAQHLELAISNPCRISSEAAHPKFGYLIPGASVVLTVNSGYE